MKENKIRSWDRQVSGEQRGHEKEMGTPPPELLLIFFSSWYSLDSGCFQSSFICLRKEITLKVREKYVKY